MSPDTDTDMEQVRRVVSVIEGPTGWLRINNPARLNAMSLSMWKDLGDGVGALAADPAVRVIIVAGSGGKAFCAGGDISEFGALRSRVDGADLYDATAKTALRALRDVAKPTIAMIEGYCLGGGLGLALQCDLRIAAENARLGIPAAKRGLSYDYAGIRQLVGLVGPSNAKHILYTARQFSAAEAQHIGLVTDTVPQHRIGEAVRELAASIAENAPLSIRASKLIVDTTVADPHERDLAACAAAETMCTESEDYIEATRSFMEKRAPIFLGR